MIARLCLALLLVAAATAPAKARMTTDEAAALLEERFAVRVLREFIEPITVDGRPAYRMRAMVDPSDVDTDGAMGVVVFMVDAWTGEMISAFRHLRSGYRLPPGGGRDANRQPPDAPRRGVWR